MEHICTAHNPWHVTTAARVGVELLVLSLAIFCTVCNNTSVEAWVGDSPLLFLPAVMPVWCLRLWSGRPLVSAAPPHCLPVVSSPQLAHLPVSIQDVCDAVKVGREGGGGGS